MKIGISGAVSRKMIAVSRSTGKTATKMVSGTRTAMASCGR
jgi:hypothetical protein